jgi:hypothetical protein
MASRWFAALWLLGIAATIAVDALFPRPAQWTASPHDHVLAQRDCVINGGAARLRPAQIECNDGEKIDLNFMGSNLKRKASQ